MRKRQGDLTKEKNCSILQGQDNQRDKEAVENEGE